MNAWPLIGVALVVLGFALRLNPAMVVVAAGVVTGLVAGKSPLAVLELLGEAFVKNRYLALFLLTLPVIGLLERHGLKEHAQRWVAGLRAATTGRLLVAYLALRQLAATLGLTALGGHPQTVRPLLAPMAEGAAQAALARDRRDTADAPDSTTDATPEALPDAMSQRIRAMSAATDNVGLFFGEDIFIAFGAVLLMQAFYADHGIVLEPLQIALWAIPTALCAFAIHAARLLRFDRQLQRELHALARTPPEPRA
ncbi:DUF969 domain-containing protein [Chiayiivirga flava]|uniref:Putative membrane protein n=1 Tax=Chiayiivirga flava TaxID=659595 RepID=A0A7W8D2B8_9GAMM|nr:DUF969 domain-containing protein [Chiayiivirga flava]MBB5206698.1 putative membrane protein [Chiayiivirga flava]